MRPTFFDEQVGGDGKRYYNIKDNYGATIYSQVTLEKDYLKLQDGTLISSAVMINLLTPDNIANYKGVKSTTSFGEQITTTLVDTENSDDIILKQVTSFGTVISTTTEYYQDGEVVYSFSQDTSFGENITSITS